MNKPKCVECRGEHEPSGARTDCIEHWRMRALIAESRLRSINSLNNKGVTFPSLSRSLAESAWGGSPVDDSLCSKFAEILDNQLAQPSLGCATTEQLLDEVKARVDLSYSTVFYEETEKPHTL